ncbi:MAG: histidine kinase N-terminal 7TM domain-containing protein [Isosphaeraceae bacterium]
MTFQANPEAIPFLIASAVATAVSAAAWRRRRHPGGLALLAMMVGETGWALFEAAELVVVDPWVKKICFVLRTSLAMVAVLGLVHFVLRYTGHTSWLKPRRCVWFWAPAVAPLVLVWTNDLHHLYWVDLPSGRFVQSYGTFLLAVPKYGPVFWIHFGFCYLLLAVVAVLLADAMSRSVGAYRVQAGVMLVGVLLPWGVNVVDMTRLFGFIHVDSVAIAFGLTGLAVLPAFYRYGLLDLAPIACAAVVRGMADPVVVLDAGGRVVALNASAEGVLGRSLAEVLGEPSASTFRHWPALADRLAGPDGAPFDVEGDGPAGGRSFEGRLPPGGQRPPRRRGARAAGRDRAAVGPRPSTPPASRPRPTPARGRRSSPSSATSCARR